MEILELHNHNIIIKLKIPLQFQKTTLSSRQESYSILDNHQNLKLFGNTSTILISY